MILYMYLVNSLACGRYDAPITRTPELTPM